MAGLRFCFWKSRNSSKSWCGDAGLHLEPVVLFLSEPRTSQSTLETAQALLPRTAGSRTPAPRWALAWLPGWCGLRPSRPASPEVVRRQSLRRSPGSSSETLQVDQVLNDSEPCGEKGSPTKPQRAMPPTPPSPQTRPSGTVRHWWEKLGSSGGLPESAHATLLVAAPSATCPAARRGASARHVSPARLSLGLPSPAAQQDGDRVWAPGQIPLLGLTPLNAPSVFY